MPLEQLPLENTSVEARKGKPEDAQLKVRHSEKCALPVLLNLVYLHVYHTKPLRLFVEKESQ